MRILNVRFVSLMSIFLLLFSMAIKADYFDEIRRKIDQMHKTMESLQRHMIGNSSKIFAGVNGCGGSTNVAAPDYKLSVKSKNNRLNFVIKKLPASLKVEDVIVTSLADSLDIFISSNGDTIELKIYSNKYDFILGREVSRKKEPRFVKEVGQPEKKLAIDYCAFFGSGSFSSRVMRSSSLETALNINDIKNIKAEYADGVLKITVPKKTVQRIPVTTKSKIISPSHKATENKLAIRSLGEEWKKIKKVKAKKIKVKDLVSASQDEEK